jgi:hypothetical protein
MGDMRNAYRVSVGKPGRKRSLGRTKRSLQDDINMNLI